MTTAMRGSVFSAEELAKHTAITVASDSPLVTAIKTIKRLVRENNPWICDLDLMKTIALTQYEISKTELSEGGDGSFVVTINDSPLIIYNPKVKMELSLYNPKVETQLSFNIGNSIFEEESEPSERARCVLF